MADFSAAVAALLAGRTVRVAHLIQLDFASETMRVWTGFGSITAGAQTWQGLGRFGSVSNLDLSPNLSAEPVTLTLSGVDPANIAKAKDQSAEVNGRRAIINFQFFDENWAPLDAPYPIFVGIMDQMKIHINADEARVDLTLEQVILNKHRPPYGNYSYHDQTGRFPGDRGLERMAYLVNKTVNWP